MYDNEAYMNTGIQRSGSTPYGAWTTTTPVGSKRDYKREKKKVVADLMIAQNVPYVATATIGFPEDLERKVAIAKSIKGPKFIQILSRSRGKLIPIFIILALALSICNASSM